LRVSACGLFRFRYSGPRSRSSLLFLGVAWAAGLSCQDTQEPPKPFPPNIDISARPTPGATLEPAAVDSVVLSFSRPMDPTSLLFLKKTCLLFPLGLDDFAGHWSSDGRRVAFALDRFPVQPGALYEAEFAGLRTLDGDLYNLGPYRVWFRTRGDADVFPVVPPVRVATKSMCHRASADAHDCTRTTIARALRAGADSLRVETLCGDCADERLERSDLYRRSAARIEWLGFDVYDSTGVLARSVRWPQPPAFLEIPAVAGATLESPAQTAPDGTRLTHWSTSCGAPDSPYERITVPGLPGLPALTVQLAFSESAVLDLDYGLESPGGLAERHRERWWLYPGVGLVRREVRIESLAGDTYDLEAWVPAVLPTRAR
jgi:hypothetical protein